jgi:hypothetical protein
VVVAQQWHAWGNMLAQNKASQQNSRYVSFGTRANAKDMCRRLESIHLASKGMCRMLWLLAGIHGTLARSNKPRRQDAPSGFSGRLIDHSPNPLDLKGGRK